MLENCKYLEKLKVSQIDIYTLSNSTTNLSCCTLLGKPSRKKSAVFLNIVQKGGGVKPMFKNYVVNLVCTGGHSTT